MNKKILIFTLMIVLFGSVILAQPKIESKENSYDFGNIKQGDVVSHNFVLTNVGTEKLVITKVRASCGCTAAAPDKKELEPGESTSVKVTFDSHGRKGVQKKYVYIFSNDPEQKQLRLEFTTKILEQNEIDVRKVESPVLELSQHEVEFGSVKQGEKKDFELYFINKGKNQLVIDKIESSCDCIVASISKKNYEIGEVGIMKISLDTTGRSGELTRSVQIYSNDTSSPVRTIIVKANIGTGDKS